MPTFGSHLFRIVYDLFNFSKTTKTSECDYNDTNAEVTPPRKTWEQGLPERRPCRHEVMRRHRVRPVAPLCYCQNSARFTPCSCGCIDAIKYTKEATRRLSDPVVLPIPSPQLIDSWRVSSSSSHYQTYSRDEEDEMDMEWIEEWLIGQHPSSPFSTDSESGSDTEFSSSSSSTHVGRSGDISEDYEDYDDVYTVACPVTQIPVPPRTPPRDKSRLGRPLLMPMGIHKSKRLRGVRAQHERSISPTPLPQHHSATTPFGLLC